MSRRAVLIRRALTPGGPAREALTGGALARWALGALGVAGIAYGAELVLTGGRSTDPVGVATWLVAVLAAHDGVLAPAVVLLGAVGARTLPTWLQAPVQAGGLVAGVLVVASAALWLGGGRRPGNPSADPLDYPRNLLLLIAVVAGATLVAALVRRRQERRARNTRPSRPQRSSSA